MNRQAHIFVIVNAFGACIIRYQVFKILLLLIISTCIFFQFNIIFVFFGSDLRFNSPSSIFTVLDNVNINKYTKVDPNVLCGLKIINILLADHHLSD